MVATTEPPLEQTRERGPEAKLQALGWGLFFIWLAIALFAQIELGVALLGVGVITLGMQAVRSYAGLRLEGFWLVVGLGFVIGGVWQLIAQELPLVPIFLLIGGAALLLSVLRGRRT